MFPRLKTILCAMLALILLAGSIPPVSATSTDTVEVFGLTVDVAAEELDLSGIKIESIAAVEEILPMLPQLRHVEMCGCGLSNEDMATLRDAHPEIKFVWEVQIGHKKVRTDIEYFMPVYLDIGSLSKQDLYNLRFCTDVILIDCGHYPVYDLSFLHYMPNIEYLLLCEAGIKDVEIISTCKNLRFLELFLCPIRDISPLVNLTKLEDLNICVVGCDYTPLLQMTWLDRLWMARSKPDYDMVYALKEALPNTTIQYKYGSSTDRGWRYAPNYYMGRDIVGGFYMTA